LFTYVQALIGQTIAQPATFLALAISLVLGITVAGLTHRRTIHNDVDAFRGA